MSDLVNNSMTKISVLHAIYFIERPVTHNYIKTQGNVIV